METGSQAQQQTYLVNYFGLMKVYPRLCRKYGLSELAQLTLHLFFTNLKNHSGNCVSLKEKRWESRVLYCKELDVGDPDNMSRCFRELRSKKVMFSEKGEKRKTLRFLSDSFIEEVKNMVKTTTVANVSTNTTTVAAASSTPVPTACSPLSQLPGSSIIEELAKGTDQSQLAEFNSRAKGDAYLGGGRRILELTKRLEAMFDMGRRDKMQNLESMAWVETKILDHDESAFIRFVEWLEKKGRRWKFKDHCWDLYFNDWANIDAFDFSHVEEDARQTQH